MKKIILASTLSLCVASAFAADTAVLKVTGKLTNASCSPELSNGGVIDYGPVHLGLLSPTEVNQLGEKGINLTITCSAPTLVGWVANDNRTSSVAGIAVDYYGEMSNLPYYEYGVGKTTNGVNIGNYYISIKNKKVTIDGKEGDGIDSNTDWNGTTWKAGSGVRSDGVTIVSAATAGTLTPVAFTTAVFPLSTLLAIQGTDTLAITDDTPLDGQATITLKYL
ncbi:DUF1120 domain-containing protein [Enterobacter hormaechei]|uniref:DUF1120 domain-containing protein n=1 Tax=Enterobacter hormaechei TaxID=158836 RepID=UPI001867C2BE|nr:DUF1120 domain-containing protein [Enterobacter hormaechei]MCW8153839.1 DUF1120 domain-containing protein [Enterobacter hormaechei]MDK3078238.1 DUF1120 domain-containing protein [Enterobacter hormaechei]